MPRRPAAPSSTISTAGWSPGLTGREKTQTGVPAGQANAGAPCIDSHERWPMRTVSTRARCVVGLRWTVARSTPRP